MLLLLLFIAGLAVAAYALEWVIDQPGSLSLDWGGYHVDTSIAVAVAVLIAGVAALVVSWAIITLLFRLPGRLTRAGRERRREKGFRALSHGIIAAAAGDVARAKKAAHVAAKYLENEPLTQLLKAQAAQLSGDRRAAEAAFHEMTLNPETKLLGLRGLHVEAQRRSDVEAAHLFASTAHEITPLPWAGSALLEHHATQADWERVRASIESNLKAKSIDLATAQRLRAVTETALAMEKQESEPIEALRLARLALKRVPDFAPAAALAAQLMSRMGDRRKATKLIEAVWAKNPHPDLAEAFLDAAPGESNTERLARVARLAQVAPTAPESRRLLARAALAARDFHMARRALAPLIEDDAKPTAQTCLLMAELEDAEHGPGGPVREWLARASHAPRDPAWIADGVVSKTWAPVSPVTGKIDAFEWKAPPEHTSRSTEEVRAAIPPAFLAPPPPRNIAAAMSEPLDGG
jgi:HemY protein